MKKKTRYSAQDALLQLPINPCGFALHSHFVTRSTEASRITRKQKFFHCALADHRRWQMNRIKERNDVWRIGLWYHGFRLAWFSGCLPLPLGWTGNLPWLLIHQCCCCTNSQLACLSRAQLKWLQLTAHHRGSCNNRDLSFFLIVFSQHAVGLKNRVSMRPCNCFESSVD